VKDAIKRGPDEAKVSLGPFSRAFAAAEEDDEDDSDAGGAGEEEEQLGEALPSSSAAARRRAVGAARRARRTEDDDGAGADEDDDGLEEDRTPIKVIRLRSRRDSNLSSITHGTAASTGGAGAHAAPSTLGHDSESGSLAPAFGGQSALGLSPPGLKKQVAQMVPFALISPEPPRASSGAGTTTTTHTPANGNSTTLDSADSVLHSSSSAGGGAGGGGPTFTRKYRWGSIHVLNPAHCDFATLRTCLLQTHVEDLREATNRKYEAYRSEMLQAIRARTSTSTSGGANGYSAGGRTGSAGGGLGYANGSSGFGSGGRVSHAAGYGSAGNGSSGGGGSSSAASRGARMHASASAKRIEHLPGAAVPETRRIPA